MIKSFFTIIGKFFLGVAGVAGGTICGCIVLLLLLHLRVVIGFELPSIFVLFMLVVPCFSVMGLLKSKFFGMFFLCPLSLFLSCDDSGGGHPSASDDSSWNELLYNASYMVGLILFGVGVFFTLPWLVGCGLFGIGIFTVGVCRLTNN